MIKLFSISDPHAETSCFGSQTGAVRRMLNLKGGQGGGYLASSKSRCVSRESFRVSTKSTLSLVRKQCGFSATVVLLINVRMQAEPLENAPLSG